MSGVNEAMYSVDRKITTIVVNGTTTYEDNFDQTLLNYMTRLEAAVDYGSRLRLVLATYPMIIIFRLFKAFSAQARLAIVTETLYVTGVDLLHFALVFASIFVTLGISGLVLFGRTMQQFTTFPRALTTVGMMCFLFKPCKDTLSLSHTQGHKHKHATTHSPMHMRSYKHTYTHFVETLN